MIYLNKAETQACVLPYTNQCHIKDTTRMLFYTAIHICMTFFSITLNYFNMKSTTTFKGWNKTFNVLNEIMFYIRAFSNHLPFWHVYDYVSFNKLIFLTISVLWLWSLFEIGAVRCEYSQYNIQCILFTDFFVTHIATCI